MQTKDIKIAVVEDDVNLRFLIVKGLESQGYQVFEAADGPSGEALVQREHPHITLMDWMLPGKTGADVCTSLRAGGYNNMVIMITAKSQDIDKITAYTAGVTDYITKPFSMDLLNALLQSKVQFLLQSNDGATIQRFADVEHHPATHHLLKAGKKVELTILENRILLYLLQNRNKVISREDLMMVVWGFNSDVNTRTLDMHIVRLRKKIEANPENPTLLQTVRGTGYMLNTD